MKLHTLPPSPNSIKVVMLANHLGMDLEIVPVDLFSGANHTPEFAAMNPNCRIPVLQDGDYYLWESNAIMTYMAGKAGNTQMWPADFKAQAEVMKWMTWSVAHWTSSCGILMFEKLVKAMRGMGEPNMERVKEGEDMIRTYSKVLDGVLAKQPFLGGNEVGMADFCVVAPLIYAEPLGLPVKDFPHMQAWMGKMMAMPAVQKAIPPMPAGVN